MGPSLGEYHSQSPAVISQHMQWFAQAGIDNVIIDWCGVNTADGQKIDANVAPVMAAAAQNGLHVIFMIDVYTGRTPQTVQSDVQYLINHYSASPAWYTTTRATPSNPNNAAKPVFYVYYPITDTSVTPSQWTSATKAIHKATNAALIVHNNYDPNWVSVGGFDGLCGYGVQANFAERNLAQTLPANAWYVPSVMPGYNALRSKGVTTIINRNNGATYDQSWQSELDLGSDLPAVNITSFNEWTETTQIEPDADGKDSDGYTWQDYGTLGPSGYLSKTASWVPFAHNYQAYNWAVAPSVYSQPGNPSTDMGLWQVSWGTTSATQVTSVGGESAVTNQPGSYLYNYMVARSWPTTTPSAYTIRVDYYDGAPGTEFRLAYNATATASSHCYSPYVQLTGSNTWRTAVFQVPAAVFNAQFGGGTDWRIETPVGESLNLGLAQVTKG
jgi:hypothetical protein